MENIVCLARVVRFIERLGETFGFGARVVDCAYKYTITPAHLHVHAIYARLRR